MFIRVDIDETVQENPDLCKQLVELCPVDIFSLNDSGRVDTVEDNLDECTLCDLCHDATANKVRVIKLYQD